MTLKITQINPDTIAVADERDEQASLFTAESSAPALITDELTTAQFAPAVDEARHLIAEALRFDDIPVQIYNMDGEPVLESSSLHATLPEPQNAYRIEINAGVRLYIRTETEFSMSRTPNETVLFDFGEERQLGLGARSYRRTPNAKVTVEKSPSGLMRGVSQFGREISIKSSEMVEPEFRAHPPLIEYGDQFSVDGDLSDQHSSGIEIEIPPEYTTIAAVTPLAYYLKADVKPGQVPRITTPSGYSHDMGLRASLSETFADLLKQVYLFDSITRSYGFHNSKIPATHKLTKRVAFDFEALYGKPLSERVERYLSIPYSTVSDILPEWGMTAYLPNSRCSGPLLPHVADQLAIVRTADPEHQQHVHTPSGGTQPEIGLERGAASSSPLETNKIVRPGNSDKSLNRAWFGDELPVRATKFLPAGYRNRVRTGNNLLTPGSAVSVAVVCNDNRMDAEYDFVEEIYTHQADGRFNVDLKKDVTSSELEATFTEDYDFLHYIGHIRDEQFLTVDGWLPVDEIETVNTSAVFLNACSSVNVVEHLVTQGAVVGSGTLYPVMNNSAEEVGENLSRLLSAGLPLQAAVEVATSNRLEGDKYVVVGDGMYSVAPPHDRVPYLVDISQAGIGGFNVSVKAFPTSSTGYGKTVAPSVIPNSKTHIGSGEIMECHMSFEELQRRLAGTKIPIRVDHQVRWSHEADFTDLSW